MNLKELILQYLLKCELQNNLDKKTLKAYRMEKMIFLQKKV